MILRIAASAIVLSTAIASAQSTTFDLFLGSRQVGRDTYALTKSGKGYKLNSRYVVKFQARGDATTTPTTVSVDFTDDFKFDPEFAYLEGTSENMDSHLMTSYAPNKGRTEMVVARSYNGRQDSTTQAIGPDMVVLNSLDAGSAETLLRNLVSRATTPVALSIYIPGQSSGGDGRGRGRESGKSSAPAAEDAKATITGKWAKAADATGTLNGKPITLHSFTLTTEKTTWTFLADDSNELMKLSASSTPPASAVRTGFKLDASPAQ
jgi:hypothetical protein